MKRLDRLVGMMLVLQQRRATPVGLLAERFGVVPRTAYRDLAALTRAGFPLTRLTAGYGVPDGYRLPPLSLTPREAAALHLGAQFVRIQTDATLTAAADSALAKIEGTLPPTVRASTKALARAVKWRGRERHRSRPGPGVLFALQQAIATRKAVRISYAGGSTSDLPDRTVEPLGLTFASDHWYLVAYCRARKDMRTFRTDRITRLEPLKETFTPPPKFSLETYLRDDARRRPASLLVDLKLSSAMAQRLKGRMGGRVAAARRLGSCVRVTVKTYGVDDAVSLALSLGSEAEVLGPPVVRDWIVRELETHKQNG